MRERVGRDPLVALEYAARRGQQLVIYVFSDGALRRAIDRLWQAPLRQSSLQAVGVIALVVLELLKPVLHPRL